MTDLTQTQVSFADLSSFLNTGVIIFLGFDVF